MANELDRHLEDALTYGMSALHVRFDVDWGLSVIRPQGFWPGPVGEVIEGEIISKRIISDE